MTRIDAPDLHEPRPGESFDEARLAAFLKGKLKGADKPLRVLQFGGGMANLTYLLRFGDEQEYVYRRPPLKAFAASAHDMSRESRVLSALSAVFRYAPRIYLHVEDPAVIGAPFIIMERKSGITVRRRMPPEFASIPDAGRQLSETLVDVLVEFHAVDYEAIGLGSLGRPHGFITRQVAGWRRRWEAAQTRRNPEADALCDWLSQNIPTSPSATLVHNDYKLDNTVFAAADPARMIALLDWDMTTIGDPLLDLATLLAYWTDPADPPHLRAQTPMPSGDYGFLSRTQLLDRYQRRSGRDVGDIRFYLALSIFRWTCYMQQMYFNFAHGYSSDERYRELDETAAKLITTALDATHGKIL